jgi:hypothetical protein
MTGHFLSDVHKLRLVTALNAKKRYFPVPTVALYIIQPQDRMLFTIDCFIA